MFKILNDVNIEVLIQMICNKYDLILSQSSMIPTNAYKRKMFLYFIGFSLYLLLARGMLQYVIL